MKKRILAILFAVVLTFSLITTASAASYNVIDYADVLTDDEEIKLNEKLSEISEEYKTEVAILTVVDFDGKSAQDYADDFYDYNDYGYGKNEDGVMVVFKTGVEGDRELYISTEGDDTTDSFSDSTIADILEEMRESIEVENYYEAFDTYANMCEEALQPPTVSLIWIPICLVVGFIIAFIISLIVQSTLRPVRKKVNAKDYVRKGSMVVTGQYDIFMYRRVDRTKIERDDDHSTTHTSSSGDTHGGGGIRF